MNKKYIVRLDTDGTADSMRDCQAIEGFKSEGASGTNALEGRYRGPAWTDARIAEAFDCR